MITIKLWLPDRQTNEETDTGQSYPRDSLLHCFALNTIFACKAKCHRYQFVHLSACVCPSVCYALLLLSPHVFCRTLVTKWTRVSSAEVLIKFDNQKVWNYSIHRWMDRHLPGKRHKTDNLPRLVIKDWQIFIHYGGNAISSRQGSELLLWPQVAMAKLHVTMVMLLSILIGRIYRLGQKCQRLYLIKFRGLK